MAKRGPKPKSKIAAVLAKATAPSKTQVTYLDGVKPDKGLEGVFIRAGEKLNTGGEIVVAAYAKRSEGGISVVLMVGGALKKTVVGG